MRSQLAQRAVVIIAGLSGIVASIAGAQSYPTERVSIDGFDIDADMQSRELEPSADGRFVAFVTRATNFSDDDPDNRYDVFVRDRFERTLDLVSIGSAAEVSDGDSRFPSISADGRFVAFESTASTFDPTDLNAQRDVYLRDRENGTTTLVSRALAGGAGNGSSGFPAVSNDGRWIAFVSDATNLVEGDTNNEQDVFLHDALLGTTRRVSVTETGAQSAGGVVGQPAMSTDGKTIAFASRASDIVSADPADFADVFVYDRCSGMVLLASRTPDAGFPTGNSLSPTISADGRRVAFSSLAEDILPDLANGYEDIFLYDLDRDETTLVSVSTTGEVGAGDSYSPSIDARGRTVVFASAAANLAADDPDGSVLDLYARDTLTERTTRQSLSWLDEETLLPITPWRLADDGNWASLASPDDLLTPDDENAVQDDYLRWIGDPCIEREPNDRFIDRTWINLDKNDCPAISGKLMQRQVLGLAPDTYLLAFDKQDNVIAQDDNSSSMGDGKASALWLEPVDHGENDDTRSIRLAVTGRPDAVDGTSNGLLFNSPHAQRGAFSLTVTYFDAEGLPVLDECEEIVTDTATSDANGAPLAFVTGAEMFRLNYIVPDEAATAHVEIDNQLETIDICNDVDYYTLAGLPPACDVAVTLLGCLDETGEPCQTRLAWFDKNANLVETVAASSTPAPLTLSAISDANGLVTFAVTGALDTDFDGEADLLPPRNVGTPDFNGPFGHGCCCCYSILVETIKHDPDPECPENEMMEQLRHGDTNLDGGVDVLDLSTMLGNWGRTF